MTGKLIRAVSLIFVIVFGAIFCGLCWYGFALFPPMIIPAIAFTGIYLWVLAMEVAGVLFGYKRTLSTRWNHFAAQSRKNAIISWLALISFFIAMGALVPHLGVYWK